MKIHLHGFDGVVLEGDVYHAPPERMPKVVTCEGRPNSYVGQRYFLHVPGSHDQYQEIDPPAGVLVTYPEKEV